MTWKRPLMYISSETMTSWITLIALAAVTSAVCVAGTSNDDAVFLSPLIADGRFEKAKCKSLVTYDLVKREDNLDKTKLKSYAGYITVNKTYDSNLFFWFFPAENNAAKAPVLLWLNGGPGTTSMIGALIENGPLKVTSKGQVVRSKVSWTKSFNMLYVDNPIGTGFSFTRNPLGRISSIEGLVPQLYSLLIQFYKMFNEYAHNDLYIGGQSYAGKYIPVLGKYIHDQNHASPPPELFLPMKGVYLGAGFCNAQVMLPEFPQVLYYTGLISDYSRRTFLADILGVINKSESTGSIDPQDTGALFSGAANVSVNGDLDNMLGEKYSTADLRNGLKKFLSCPKVRKALHVGLANQQPAFIPDSDDVYIQILLPTLFVDTNSENVFLMDNYKFLHYSGNLDLIVSVPATETFLQQLQWTGADQYRDSIRYPWSQDGSLRGWVTQIGNFTRAVVRNAGHQVPFNQPEAALLMMENFVFDKPFL